jgi:hypothetical protein
VGKWGRYGSHQGWKIGKIYRVGKSEHYFYVLAFFQMLWSFQQNFQVHFLKNNSIVSSILENTPDVLPYQILKYVTPLFKPRVNI